MPYHARRWLIVAPASIALGALLTHLGVPAAWILAAIVVSGAAALSTGRDLPVNEHFYAFARGIIGVVAAVPLLSTSPGDLLRLLPAGLMVAFVTIAIGIAGGLLLHRTHPAISRESGILSMLAGGASIMPAIAHDVGADPRYVSLTQYLRLLAVSISLPLLTGLMTTPAGTATSTITETNPLTSTLATVLIALIGAPLGKRLRLPAASVFGPLLLTVATGVAAHYFGLSTLTSLHPPFPLQILAFLAIGWACGGALSIPALKLFAQALPATITFIVVIISACALTALPLTVWLDLTYFESYLATSPGALETVRALGAEGGAGPEVVVIQLIRLIAILLVAGWLPQLLRR